METIKAIILACQINGGNHSSIQMRLQQECQRELAQCVISAPGSNDAVSLVACMMRKTK